MCTPNLNLGANTSQDDPSTFGKRTDGTPKGKGYLGVLKRPDGGVSTELSAGFNIDGQETDIPLLVPTLSKQEVDYLLSAKEDDKDYFKKMPPQIMDKALEHAKKRRKEGKSVYAD